MGVYFCVFAEGGIADNSEATAGTADEGAPLSTEESNHEYRYIVSPYHQPTLY